MAYYTLLHRIGGHPDEWEKVTSLLENKGHKCYAPKIDYLSNPNLKSIKRDILGLIPEEFISKDAIVAGNSLGATLSLVLGDYFGKIMLIGPYIKNNSQSLDKPIFDDEIKKLFFNVEVLSEHEKEIYRGIWNHYFSNRRSLFSLNKDVKYFDPYPLINTYKDKLHFVCGKNDEISPLDFFQGIRDAYPTIPFYNIPECGHVTPVEKPEELTEILLR